MIYPLHGSHDEVIGAFSTNEEVFFERLIKHHSLATGTLCPQTYRHAVLSQTLC